METLFHSRANRRWSKAHIAELALILGGLVCVGWFVFAHLDARIYQMYENYRLDSSIQANKNQANKQPQIETAPTPAQPQVPPLATGETIGRIEIPRIQVSTIVREGSDTVTLKRAAGHVPATALPGQQGNVGIAAHRDTFFRNLRHVREGDLIRITTSWGVYEYAVDSLKIVMPENIEVLDPTPTPSVTLVTCYPFNYVGSAPKRFIVRARQVNPAVPSKDPVTTTSPRGTPDKVSGLRRQTGSGRLYN